MAYSSWEKFLLALKRTYYTEIVVLLVSFFVLYLIIRNFHKKKLSYLFLIYTINCILLFGGLTIYRIFFLRTGRMGTVIIETSNTFFAICELCVFTVFFSKIIESRTSKKLLVLFSGCFLIAIIVFFVKVLNVNAGRDEIMKASLVINILEFAIFLIAILSYFIELFKQPPTQDLTHSPTFWISSGLFIYILASLPLLLFAEYIWIENRSLYFLLFSFHFLSLTLLLLTIAKAILCRQPITT